MRVRAAKGSGERSAWVTRDPDGEWTLVVAASNGEFVDDLRRALAEYDAHEAWLHKHFTYLETARILGIGLRTLQRWVAERKVSYQQLGRRVRFRGRDIEAIQDLMARGILRAPSDDSRPSPQR